MVRKTLIDRIGEIENLDEVNRTVRRALSVPHINPRSNWQKMPYFKYDLSDRIAQLLGEGEFSNNLNSSVNKDVLKRVYYGILSTGEISREFLEKLTNWEKIYFFRGRWSERDPNLSHPLLVLASEHIHLGLENLHRDHYVRKAKGVYRSEKKFPEADFIREDYQKIMDSFYNTLPEPESSSEPIQLKLFS